MRRDEKLNLPVNWEEILEQMILRWPINTRCERIYICSPCRADTPEGVIRNMKAARVYMFYTSIHFVGVPKAPHAYLPVLLNDLYEDERELALRVGKQFLKGCDRLFVCGDRLSEGMYSEVTAAVRYGITISVFNRQVYEELLERFAGDGVDPESVHCIDRNLHYALSWGADELAPYWEEAQT